MQSLSYVINSFEEKRKKIGMTKAELCRRAGISEPSYDACISEGGNPTRKTIEAIMAVFSSIE